MDTKTHKADKPVNFKKCLNHAMSVDLTQADVAAASGIDKSTIGDYVKGTSTPNVDRLFALCRGLRISPGKLLDKEFDEWKKGL